MMEIIKECWCQNAAARLTSLRINKKLTRLLADCKSPVIVSEVEQDIIDLLKPSSRTKMVDDGLGYKI